MHGFCEIVTGYFKHDGTAAEVGGSVRSDHHTSEADVISRCELMCLLSRDDQTFYRLCMPMWDYMKSQ